MPTPAEIAPVCSTCDGDRWIDVEGRDGEVLRVACPVCGGEKRIAPTEHP